MNGINLLPQEIQKERRSADRAVMLNAVSVAALVMLGSVVLVLFSYRLYLSRQVQDLDSQIQAASKQVQDQKEVEGRLRAVQQKLARLGQVWARPRAHAQAMADLQEVAGESSRIVSLTYDEETGGFTARLTVPSVSGAAALLESLEEKDYEKVRLTSVQFQPEEGGFRVEIGFQ